MSEYSQRVNIIVVNYKKAQRLVFGLEALFRQSCAEKLNILVHDNSCDDSEFATLSAAAQSYPISLFRSDENLGYCAGVNSVSRRIMDSGHIILMSPDIILTSPDIIGQMVDSLERDPTIGIVATPQINDDGSIPEVARKFPTLLEQLRRRLLGSERGAEVAISFRPCQQSQIDVDWVQSSFVIIRRELWNRLDGLDERYFIFMGDIDLCLRTWRSGFRVVIENIQGVRADGIRASASSVLGSVLKYSVRVHLRDALLFYFVNGPFRLRVRA